jgi:hypothetical protein
MEYLQYELHVSALHWPSSGLYLIYQVTIQYVLFTWGGGDEISFAKVGGILLTFKNPASYI